MSRRTALDIKKEIILLLRNKEMSLRELESKIDTNNKTIRTQIGELAYFNIVEVLYHKRSLSNGRAYTTVRLKKSN